MSPLNRMLLRDLWRLRGQVLAISLVVACAVASYVAMHGTYRSLLLSRDDYYARYRFADVFATFKRAPERMADRIRRIPGVAAVQTRIVVDVTLDVPGLREPATGRMVSIPERRGATLNDICLRQGRYPEAGRSDEILASEAFATANRLRPGDRLGAIINGRRQELRIVGIALSPEYVYEVQGGGSLFPDNKRFGVLWMGRDSLAPPYRMEGAFNDLALTLSRGASEAEVIAAVDRILAPYGCLGAYGRNDQLSYRFLADEISQNRISATYVPAIFLAIVAFLLHMALSRLTAMQRTQIGLLKAFGYSSAAVGRHYLKLACCAVAGGAVAGIAAGWYLGFRLTMLYRDFYRFPLLRYESGADVAAIALGITLAAALAGAWGATRGAMALSPAEAMRPELPTAFHSGLFERSGLIRISSTTLRMIVRNIERRFGKACLSMAGIACAAAILVVGQFFYDSIEQMMRIQFDTIQREDVSITFTDPRSSTARQEVAALPAVLRSETYRSVAVRLTSGHRSKRLAITGLDPNGELRRLIGSDLQPLRIPPEGLVLSRALAEALEVSPGEPVTVEILEGSRPVRRVPVTSLVDDLIGLSAYMERTALNRLLDEGSTISGAFLAVDPQGAERLYTRLKHTPAVSGTAVRESMLSSVRTLIAESLAITTSVLVVFSCIIASGMVYNGVRISLSERGHELACLRVLGFTHREVSLVLLGEQALLTGAAIPFGWMLGFALSAFLAGRMSTELYRMPLIISSSTYAFSFLVVAAAAILSGLLVYGQIRRLDLIAVLKERE
ncbi:MAG: ABC transporter permease [Desulfuromonadaceae bacterium]|nr:ABC transporter permease [Desulfuromonadaceae bacterium]MDD2849914.1 ABC transporter permease [Desulfuromonadaceae bacterium]MDD4131727.1 ABC transporter permease [Desulfuromonadaceae bacterium]